MLRLIIIGSFLFLNFATAYCQDATIPGEVSSPYPTITNLAVEWMITGDDNVNGIVTVHYREKGNEQWNEGMPLRRILPGRHYGFSWQNRHSGSIFELKPNTTYEIKLNLNDPDGGNAEEFLEATTRPVPVVDNNAEIIDLEPGTYDTLHTKSGTQNRPVVYRCKNGKAVFRNIDLRHRQWVYLDGLDVINNRKKGVGIIMDGCENCAITYCSIQAETGILADLPGAINCYFADNTLQGVCKWKLNALGNLGKNAGEGIQVTGSGNVICYNKITGFRDNVSTMEGDRASKQFCVDIFNNDIYVAVDDGVECDFSYSNCRVYRNRMTDCCVGVSSQPSLGGPTYFFRNVMYNIIHGAFKLKNFSVGDVVLHNTVVKIGAGLGGNAKMDRAFFRNNLAFGGPTHGIIIRGGYDTGKPYAAEMIEPGSHSSFDYDAVGVSGTPYLAMIGDSSFESVEAHGIGNLDFLNVFPGVIFPQKPLSLTEAVPDLRPAKGSKVIDAAVLIPNINDHFNGNGPDIGAYEEGEELPHYGPRPRPTIGFGKSNLTQAGLYDDPVDNDQNPADSQKYHYENKFGISDRVEGRWRPGSGGTRRLEDSIYVSAMYGEDAKGPWAIVAVDEMEFFYELLDKLEYPLIHEMGISKERLVFLPSHSHASPKFDVHKYQKAVFDAVMQAKANRSEVEIASLDLKIDGKKYVVNRRIFVDSVGTYSVLFNDDGVVHDRYLDATNNIQQWLKNLVADSVTPSDPRKKYITSGEVDNNLQALFFRDKKSGEMKGSFLRFAAHAVIVSSKLMGGDVSADFPGYMKRKIEKDLGGVALFAQGASGDLRPLNKEYSHRFAKSYGEQLADEILESYKELKWQPLTTTRYYTQPVALRLDDSIFYSKDVAEKEMTKVEVLYDKEIIPWKKRALQNKFWNLYRTPDNNGMIRSEWRERKRLDLNLYALQLNDKVILAANGELFTRIGQQMVEPFSEKKPLLVTIANESISYVSTDEERENGGYEPSVSIVAAGSADTLIQSAHRFLSGIYDLPLNIKNEYCVINEQEILKNKITQKPVLQGEIEDVGTNYIELSRNSEFKYKPRQNAVSVFLLTHGSGVVYQGVRKFDATGVNLFVPSVSEEASIAADSNNLGMLEIVVSLREDEMQLFKQQQDALPYFVDYTKSRQYREAIKSEKTISRMILPEGIVPRFCMGSVETTGPDEIGAHTHPMLEQLFFGLANNDCVVTADGIKAGFRENMLLHIPLGSRHGVKVHDGKRLNYIWMDHFRNSEDMIYIKANHIMKDE
ncbi:MAG: right-handed parallel beta-helix repeat-containing protein [Chitinophagaceae bacterium]|nr:right-handed parallel beta-helix repeat-containing protein [Chitinophagaceae bacterium]